MAQDDLSLLFRLRGDASSAKAATAEARAAVASLRQSFGSDFLKMESASKSALAGIGNNLNAFVAQRIPLVGGAFVKVTENLRGLGGEAGKQEKAIASVAKSIDGIATASGKTAPQIASFLTHFTKIEGQANRDAAAINFFGAALGAKLLPQLEKAGAELATVASESAAAGTSLAAMAGPIGIAALAIGAMVAASALLGKELFDLTKRAADFSGKDV